MKIKMINGAICSILLLGAATVASAQSSGPVKPQYQIPTEQPESEDAPKGINAGEGLTFYPKSNFSIGKDTNLFLANSGARSSTFYLWNPAFILEAKSQSSIYKIDYDAKLNRYDKSSADDYTDQALKGTAEYVFDRSTGLRLGAEYNSLHDPRGSTDTAISASPDQYYLAGPTGLFAYGANDAFGRFELQGGLINKRYTNNRANTAINDRDTGSIATRFFVRVAPKTSILFEARNDRFDYVSNLSLQDSKERRYFVGVTWEATAATTGTIKIGRLKKDFDSGLRQDSSTGSWEANVQWKPMSYSTFDFATSKSTAEATGLGDFILTKRYALGWTHGWTSRVTSAATFSHTQDDFVSTNRSDKTNSLGFKLSYKLSSVWNLAGEINHTKRDSSISQFQYDRNLYQLTLGAAL